MSGDKSVQLSIITSIYSDQRIRFLSALLNSIVGQSHREYEVTIVVDGPESLHQSIETLVNSFKEIKVKMLYTKHRLGASGSRNVGARSASSEVICFVDDDVVLGPDWAMQVASAFHSGKIHALVGTALPLWESARDSWLPVSLHWIVSCTDWLGHGVREIGNMWTMNSAIEKDLFISIGGFNENLGPAKGREAGYLGLAEDLEFSLRLRKAGHKIFYVPQVTCSHHIQHSQVSFRYIAQRALWIGFERRTLMTRKAEYGNLNLILMPVVRDFLRFTPSGRHRFLYAFRSRIAICVAALSALCGFLLVNRAST